MYLQPVILSYPLELEEKTLLLRIPHTHVLKHGQIQQEVLTRLSTFHGIVKCYVYCRREKAIIALAHLQMLWATTMAVLNRHTYWCHSRMTASRVSYCFLFGLKA